MNMSQAAFVRLQKLFHGASGINLAPGKKTLMTARLRKRVEALGLGDFDAYSAYVSEAAHAEERQRAVDLLTTNETYFFREPSHFTFLAKEIDKRAGQPLRIWSAACSTGEEAYSLAMTMLDRRSSGDFQLFASDLSTRVLERAARGVYPMSRLEHMPQDYLKRFCQRGRNDYEGMFRVAPALRKKVEFFRHNLMESARPLGEFDIIFIRNVLIYFDAATKAQVVRKLADQLRPSGLLFVGQAEGLHGMSGEMTRVERSVYQRGVRA